MLVKHSKKANQAMQRTPFGRRWSYTFGKQMTFLIPVPVFLAIPFLIYAFVLFDSLVRTEHYFHHDAWLSDGRPAGMFWRDSGCTWFCSYWHRNILMFSWLFTTPKWIMEGTDERKRLRRLRWCVLVWNISIPFSLLLWFVIPK